MNSNYLIKLGAAEAKLSLVEYCLNSIAATVDVDKDDLATVRKIMEKWGGLITSAQQDAARDRTSGT